MVSRDLSETQNDGPLKSIGSNPPPYLDRFFANVIDFTILVPVISLFNSGITNDLRWSIFNQSSLETYQLIIQGGFIGFSLFLLYETLFIYFHKATPGHRFMYLRLVSGSDEKLTLFQVFFRTLFKFQALLACGIPFVEVFLKDDRSMFYDRLSQTKLVSLREFKSDTVHPEIRNIISRWAHTALILFFVFVGLGFYRMVDRSNNQFAAKKISPRCQDSLTHYLKSYLAKTKESESLNCARQVVERSFEDKATDLPLNYLAQMVISPMEDLKESYKKKYCVDRGTKPLCQTNWQANAESFKPDDEDVVNLLVQMNTALDKNDHEQVFSILDLVYTYVDWNKNLELYYLTSYIFLSENQSRSPASEKIQRPLWQTSKARFLKRMSVTP